MKLPRLKALACLLLALGLVQLGSASQWHELEHIGERLAGESVPAEHEPTDHEPESGLHALCEACLAFKIADPGPVPVAAVTKPAAVPGPATAVDPSPAFGDRPRHPARDPPA